jgi:hypothetical protein
MKALSGKFKRLAAVKNRKKTDAGLALQVNKCYKLKFFQRRGLPGGSNVRSEQRHALQSLPLKRIANQDLRKDGLRDHACGSGGQHVL